MAKVQQAIDCSVEAQLERLGRIVTAPQLSAAEINPTHAIAAERLIAQITGNIAPDKAHVTAADEEFALERSTEPTPNSRLCSLVLEKALKTDPLKFCALKKAGHRLRNCGG